MVDDAVLSMVDALCGQDHVRVEQEHTSPTPVEVESLVEYLVQRTIRRQIDAGMGATASVERRHHRALLPPGGDTQLTTERGVDDLAERLAPFPGQSFRGGKELIRDRDCGAHDD